MSVRRRKDNGDVTIVSPYTATGWRRWWIRWLPWFPIQFCFVCRKAYWGGLPRYGKPYGKWGWKWLPAWKDYCSQACCDTELEALDDYGDQANK